MKPTADNIVFLRLIPNHLAFQQQQQQQKNPQRYCCCCLDMVRQTACRKWSNPWFISSLDIPSLLTLHKDREMCFFLNRARKERRHASVTVMALELSRLVFHTSSGQNSLSCSGVRQLLCDAIFSQKSCT